MPVLGLVAQALCKSNRFGVPFTLNLPNKNNSPQIVLSLIESMLSAWLFSLQQVDDLFKVTWENTTPPTFFQGIRALGRSSLCAPFHVA